MPKGGFGNLIALPLQHFPRWAGNSVFLQKSLEPYEDQWAVLASVQRLKAPVVEAIVAEAERAGRVIGVRLSLCNEDAEEEPWSVSLSKEVMQCGPIRYHVNPRIQSRNRPFEHFVVPRFTGFCLPLQTGEPEINEIYSALIHDEQRNEMIVQDLLNAVRDGRRPIAIHQVLSPMLF
jgi:hypothetical protein